MALALVSGNMDQNLRSQPLLFNFEPQPFVAVATLGACFRISLLDVPKAVGLGW